MPVLLASIVVEAAAYTFRVTDMANMWVESLDRKAICMRGWAENTTIDPSDTPENMTKFLESIRCAFYPSQAGHEGTSMSLARASVTDAGEGGLTLRITCELPGLKALKWPVHLRKASSSNLTTSFIMPLIQALHVRNRELNSLVTIMGQKDAVLTKLLDKLEATGTGLEHVFNSLSGKKKVSRAAAADKVKGLAPFDKRRWQKDVQREDGPDSAPALVHQVFDADNVPRDDAPEVEDPSKLDRWWLDLEGTLQIPQNGDPKAAKQRGQIQSPPPSHDTPADDDDFQIQATPPHLESTSKHKPLKTEASAIEDSTDSEEEEKGEPAPSKSSAKQKPQTSKPRLGAVGGKRNESPKNLVAGVDFPPPNKKDVAHKDSDDDTASTASSSAPSSPKKAIPTRAKLGRIGGSRAAPPQPEDDKKGSEEEKSKLPSPRPPRLGTIGGSKAARDKTPSSSKGHDERGRTREARSATPDTRETSAERADRRREELKRDLEKKAAAGPAKKKRKF